MKRISTLLMACALAVPAACGSGPSTPGDDDDGSGSGSGSGSGDEFDQELANREFDYPAALRIAALRLTGDLPTVAEINEVATPTDLAAQKAAYDARITEYVTRPAFARQMFYFWRDTFKIGETAEFDTAPALAAQLSFENGSYMNLLTQNANNCPTFDEGSGTFTPAECAGNGPKAGVLSNPGVMKQFFGNLAFRRVKWVEETFDCTKYPVEIDGEPQDVGGASPYVGVWPFLSIAGQSNGGRINFHDVSAVICANCHQTINHIAPLFGVFDENGVFQNDFAVPLPIDGSPTAKLSDWLPPGETTAWRFGVPAADIPALGSAMAADPSIAKCGVARVWNWALGKKDIVDALEEVPAETIQAQIDAFTANGFKLRDLIVAVYTSEDFTKF